jgi:hypothetical protein
MDGGTDAMSRFHCILFGVAVAGLAAGSLTSRGQAQGKFAQDVGPGPANQPALRLPWETSPATTPGPATPGMPAFLGGSSAGAFKPIPPYQELPDPNKDILVTTANGPWMICVHWYSGKEAHQMARDMVMELRDNYKLAAFVFNKGADERRKEYERRKELAEKQRDFLEKNKLPPTSFRFKTMQIEDQCAILVGNYADPDIARRALDQIRNLKPPNPERVKLATVFRGVSDQTGKINKGELGEHVFVNPFATAFVVHNPLVKLKRPDEWQQEDLASLRKLNRGEDYSLFNCKKPYTLMVKQFLLPSVIQSKSAGGKFLESIGIGKNTNSENVALNAHNMAKLFRSYKLDAYVLHTRFSSIVTVGDFDDPDDASLKSTQELLTTRLKIPQAVPVPVGEWLGMGKARPRSRSAEAVESRR